GRRHDLPDPGCSPGDPADGCSSGGGYVGLAPPVARRARRRPVAARRHRLARLRDRRSLAPPAGGAPDGGPHRDPRSPRDRRLAPGVMVGLAVAIKLFLWPLGIWLLARRQFAATAIAAAIGIAGALLVLPFTSLSSYLHLMGRMDATYGSGSYNLVGLAA